MLLPKSFYLRTDVLQIAQDLLGKVIITNIEGKTTTANIVETEAYRAPDDKACHAYNNRRTARTETMFQEGGRSYVYLCYGIHHLFNVVTAPAETAHAILIRGVEPIEGIETMLERRNFSKIKPQLSAGPGTLSKALGITTALNNVDLTSDKSPIWIEDRGIIIPKKDIKKGKRIGVDYAAECADWEWRFWVDGSKWVSRGSGTKKLKT